MLCPDWAAIAIVSVIVVIIISTVMSITLCS